MIKTLRFFIFLLLFVSLLDAKESLLQKVSLQLNWKHQFEFAGYYMAQAKGYYKDAGLDVQIHEFENNVSVVQSVLNGKNNFGVTYSNALLYADKVLLLAAIFQSSPHVFVSLKSSGIHSIADFRSKRVMISQEEMQNAAFISMLHSQGVLYSDMQIQKPTFDVESLIYHKTDIASYYITNEVYKLAQMGIEYDVWDPKDYGFDFYDGILFTSKAFAQKNPLIVEGFTQASLKGWKYALSHIDETVALIQQKYNTQHKSEGALLYEARIAKELIFKDDIPLGNIDKEKIKRVLDIYSFLRFSQSDVDIDSLIYKLKCDKLSTQENAYLKKKKVIRMCVDPDWMPLEAIKNGKYVGIGSEYFSLFEKKFSLPIELVETKKWSESLAYAKERKCDIVAMINKTRVREKFLNFTDPYLKVSVAMATKQDRPYISDLKQLKNKSVAIVKGYAFINYVKLNYPNLRIVEVKNMQEGLQRVTEGKVYGYVDALPVLVRELQSKYANTLKILDVLKNRWKFNIGVRNDDKMLYNIMQKAANSVDDQTQLQILNKYMPVMYDAKEDNSKLYLLIAFFAIIFGIGMLFYLKLLRLKNKILKQKNALLKSYAIIRERERELKLLATTDYLTKLYNRRAFGEISESIFHLAKREKEKFSIVMLDIDDFKKVNDTYGHKAGDDVLVNLSNTLKEMSRESDIVCRYGGEEFILLLPKTDVKGAYFIAQKIKKAVEKLHFTVSLGVSEVDLEHDKNIEAVIKRADDALYESKRNGKNRVTIA